jgi:ribose 1,5-bisphosphokinase
VEAKRLPKRPTRPAKPLTTRPLGRRAGPKTLRSGPATVRKPRAKPGLLVLIVGPSGAGKDTLLASAQRKFKDNPAMVFPRRTITRSESIGETHDPVSRREFQRLEKEGAFLLAWTAHGLRYGISIAVERDLKAGRIVVVNVSREIVTAACARWPKTRIVHVTVALDALRSRLETRGREAAGDIDKRIKRAARANTLPEALTDTIDNSGRLGPAVRKFNALLAGYVEANAKR